LSQILLLAFLAENFLFFLMACMLLVLVGSLNLIFTGDDSLGFDVDSAR
jgi:hypothetical protein